MMDLKKVSLRYDNSSETYYCFYHQKNDLSSELILSYDIKENKWNIDTIEYKNIFEDKFNELFQENNRPFEEQLPYVIDYLDTYFMNQSQQKRTKINVINSHIYPFGWVQRLRGIRRWASQDIPEVETPVLQRYSAPAKSTSEENQEQIISVKTLAESFYTKEINRMRTKTFASPSEYENNSTSIQMPVQAPPISEIWLNVTAEKMDDIRKKIGNRNGEEKLKKLADKFVTYFSGIFQCNVGHKYQLTHDGQTWEFIVLKVEFSTKQTNISGKPTKTRIIFLIDGIPHYVRG